MRLHLIAALLVLAGPALAGGRRKAPPQERIMPDDWRTLNMEAKAIMGELKYQGGDADGARQVFRDSINESTKLLSPGEQVMGLDLYRSAELAARNGDFTLARQQLEILLNRYPGSDFARKAQDLLDILPKKRGAGGEDDTATPIMSAEQPEFVLSRIHEALQDGDEVAALESCREFAERFPGRREEAEIRLLASALYLKQGQPDRAARILKALIARTADGALRAKAIHLLGAADADLGDFADILKAVPAAPYREEEPWLSRAQLWRAAALERLGRHAEAEKAYSGLTDPGFSSPVRVFALTGLAGEQDRRGKLLEAQKNLAEAAKEAPRYALNDVAAAAKLSEAHMLYGRGLFAQAAKAYDGFAEQRPSDPLTRQALYQEGLALKRCGRPRDAAAAFHRLLELAPDSVYAADAHLQLGQLYDRLGEHGEAVAQYEEMGKSGGRAGAKEALLLQAQVHYNAKRYKEAAPLYSRFLQAYPNDARAAEVQDLLLNSYWLGDRDNPELARAAALYPHHPLVKHIRWETAVKAYQRRDYAKADEALALYAADYPKDAHAPESLFYQGEARMKLGDWQGAALAYKSLLARFPKDSRTKQASLRLGAALYAAGDFSGSAEAYAVASEGSGKESSDALYSRAVSLLKASDKPEALAAFEQMLKRFPEDARASSTWLETGRLREELGKPADAAFAYAHVSTDDPNYGPALFSAGRLREKLKQRDLAIRNYEKLKASRPADAAARLRGLVRLGLLYELKGAPMKAMPLYAEVLKLAPRGGEDFSAARQRMQSITGQGLLTQR